MNENFGVKIEANGLNEARLERIRDALSGEWNFEEDEIHFSPRPERTGHMIAESMGEPCGMEPPTEFAERIARAIWVANRKYCTIKICAEGDDDYIVFKARDYRRIVRRRRQRE